MSERELRPAGDTQVLGSVSNAARVLKEFGKDRPDLGVSDLARRLGLGKSTTHRLLHTLAVEQLLVQDPESGRYRLSATVHELGARVPAAGRAGHSPGWSQPASRQEGSR
ncbi:MAG: helix-turn-helix domain-containing protein [Candidatus Nanopelagicales bacterium]